MAPDNDSGPRDAAPPGLAGSSSDLVYFGLAGAMLDMEEFQYIILNVFTEYPSIEWESGEE